MLVTSWFECSFQSTVIVYAGIKIFGKNYCFVSLVCHKNFLVAKQACSVIEEFRYMLVTVNLRLVGSSIHGSDNQGCIINGRNSGPVNFPVYFVFNVEFTIGSIHWMLFLNNFEFT